MTVGEINAVIWARTRDHQQKENDTEQLYQELMEMRKDG